ncbi:MAG: hypothetical protein HUU01_08305 [Saprospiraceae bacterium]|nr:hypothetical protein [Saprospiraceae bacterium]
MFKQYRYPGARPFDTAQQHIFFGRATDVDALERLLSLEQLVVLYGKSGLGKSSLLNAGLLPRAEANLKLQPQTVRFGAFTKDNPTTPLEKSKARIVMAPSPLLDRIHPNDEDSLWYHLKSRQLADNEVKNKGFLLVFDQFEELFTYPEEDVKNFARQLSEALFTTIPDRYRAQLKLRMEEHPDFLSAGDLERLHTPFRLKVLMAIRSDRMELLNRLKAFLPQIMDNLHELSALDPEQAEAAILSPAFAPGDFASPSFDYEDPALDQLLDFLSDGGTETIESFQLQILCSHLEQEVVIKQGRRIITLADLENPADILENYYLLRIGEIANDDDRLAARHLIEDGLIFEEEERRISLYEGQVLRDYGIRPELLRQLLDTHLIRSEPSLRGGYTYELSHDTLVAPVLRAKAVRLEAERIRQAQLAKQEQEKALAELRQKAEEEAAKRKEAEALRSQAEAAQKEAELARTKAEEEKQKAQKNFYIAMGMVVLSLISSILAGYLYDQAEKERANLEIAKKEADEAQQDAQNKLNAYVSERAKTLVREGDEFYRNDEVDMALYKYIRASELTPDDEALQKKIKFCKEILKEK